LPNAIALNSSMVNGSRIIGPSIGGLLIATVGEGWCFMADAISYVAVIASLIAMHVTRAERVPSKKSMGKELRTGFDYVRRSRPIRTALTLLALVSMMGMPYTVLMPAIATRVLHGDAHTLGYLMTATGAGALAGALYLASRPSVLGLGRVIVFATLAFGAGLVAFSLSRAQWLSIAILPIVGAGFMIQMASTNTVIQTIVEEQLRGRVMAFYTMAFLGTAPIGSLLAGAIAEKIGAPRTVMLGGAACIAGGLWFASRLPMLRKEIRPIYESQGILTVAAVSDVDSGAKVMTA
ncbi:MAG: MFS transporter, partial [Gemmatimonadaceae bacterium]